MTSIERMGEQAKLASRKLMTTTTLQRDRALLAMAAALQEKSNDILNANELDLKAATESGMGSAMLDRLRLNYDRIMGMVKGVKAVAGQQDPIGYIDEGAVRPNGLMIQKVRVPLGVVGVIFESRPNVTVDISALCLKSANVVILRGGKEAIHSNSKLAEIMRTAVEKEGLPADCIQLITDTSRESAKQIMRLRALDVLVPRGGAGLIRSVVENAIVPIIETGVGNCHLYIDRSANLDMAVAIADNAKTSRPSVCNAIESLLIHADIAEKALPLIAERLGENSVQIRGCPRTCALVPAAIPATDEDYYTEYLDYIIAVKVVDSLNEAIAHIAKYSSGHSECIVTEDLASARQFMVGVDSAAVYINASTRFTDGGEFGLGAEIGISTQKLHARGPMGIKALTSSKYVIYGDGQVR